MREIEVKHPLIRQGLRKFKDAFSLADTDERMRKAETGETPSLSQPLSLLTSAPLGVGVCLGKRPSGSARPAGTVFIPGS